MTLPSSTNHKGKVALIDGDTLVYRCAFAAEKTHYLIEARYHGELLQMAFDNFASAKQWMKEQALKDDYFTIWSRKEVQPVENALQATKTSIEHILAKLEPQDYEVYLSGKHNFRDGIATTKPYKGNRDSDPKPTHWRAVREYLAANWGAEVSDNVEADDELGIRATELGEDSIIVTNDKDLDQVAGWHYNWVDDRVYRVTPREASFAFYCQLLSGDPTDNVPGLAGIGPAKARGFLEGAKNTKDLFVRCWDLYRDRLGDPEHAWSYMMEQGQLLYILRYPSAREYPEMSREWLPMTYEEAQRAIA